MIVYNIRKARYASKLVASGIANRWNKEEEFVVYTGESIALSMLELLAHKSSIRMGEDYRLLFIKIDVENIPEIYISDLPEDWKSIQSYPVLQEIGSNWYKNQKSLALKIPSALIPLEHNYMINTMHPLFKTHVSLISVETFDWDIRLF